MLPEKRLVQTGTPCRVQGYPVLIRIEICQKGLTMEPSFPGADLKNARHYPALTNPETNGLHLYVEISRLR